MWMALAGALSWATDAPIEPVAAEAVVLRLASSDWIADSPSRLGLDPDGSWLWVQQPINSDPRWLRLSVVDGKRAPLDASVGRVDRSGRAWGTPTPGPCARATTAGPAEATVLWSTPQGVLRACYDGGVWMDDKAVKGVDASHVHAGPDGGLAVTSRGEIIDLARVKRIDRPRPATRIQMGSCRAGWCAALEEDGTRWTWNRTRGYAAQQIRGQERAMSVLVLPDGGRLWVSDRRLWTERGSGPDCDLPFSDLVNPTAIASSPDGTRAYVGGQSLVHVVDLSACRDESETVALWVDRVATTPTGWAVHAPQGWHELQRSPPGLGAAVEAATDAPPGAWAYRRVAEGRFEGGAELVAIRAQHRIIGARGEVWTASEHWRIDGGYQVLGGAWFVPAEGEPIALEGVPEGSVTALGTGLLAVAGAEALRWLPVGGGPPIASMSAIGPIRAVAMSEDDAFTAVATPEALALIELREGAPVARAVVDTAQDGGVVEVAFRDGELAAVGEDGTLVLLAVDRL